MEYSAKKRVTHLDCFLSEIVADTPWAALVAIAQYYPRAMDEIGSIGGRLDFQILAYRGFYILEAIFALTLAFQIYRALRL